jgi:hypothetical protein
VPKKPPDPAPRAVGRPKSRPAGARFRGAWLTDAEWAAVRALVARLRRAKPA